MVSTIDNIRISDYPAFDRRRKLTEQQYKEIHAAWFDVHESERPTLTALGERFGVHRTRISQILYPERDSRDKKNRQTRQKDGRYYNREKARQNLQSCRDYKRQLIEQGELSL